MHLPKLAKLGNCYSPALTNGQFKVRQFFVRLHRPEYKGVRSRLLACTPKAWKKIRNNKPLLEMLRQDIGPDGKGNISPKTERVLNEEFIAPIFAANESSSAYICLHLLGSEERRMFESIFECLKDPTNRNLKILEKITGRKLNINKLNLDQRKRLLAWLRDNGYGFEDIGRITITLGYNINLTVKRLPDNSLHIVFPAEFDYAADGRIEYFALSANA